MLRYEIWTRPESSNTFARRFPLKDVVASGFTTDLFGRGRITLPANHPRLDEIQYLATDITDAANRASIVRVFDGETHYCDLYIDTVEVAYTDVGSRTAELVVSGPGSMLERHRLRQFDYNANPSLDPDWVYGTAGDELDNSWEDAVFLTDFEDGGVGGFSELTGVNTNPLTSGPDNTTAEAETGTHSLTFDATQRHSGIVKTIQVEPGVRGQITIMFLSNTTGKRFTGFVKHVDGDTDHSVNGHLYSDYHLIELDNVAAGGSGLPPGSSDGTWQTIAIDYTPGPDQTEVEFGVQYDHHDGSNGPVAYIDEVLIAGFGFGLGDWNAAGALDTLTVDPTPPVGMTGYSQAIQFKPSNTTANVNGIQQTLEGQTIGQTKTFQIDVYHEAGLARDFTARIYSGTGAIVATTTVSVPTATTTTISVTGTITTDKARMVLTKGDATAAFDVWAAGMRFAAGQGRALVGKIMNDLLDSKTGQYIADTLTRTWTDTLDSAGNAWDGDIAIRFRRGVTFRSIVEDIQRLGYEVWMDTNPADHTDWRMHIYNPDGMGIAKTFAILTRPGLAAAGPIRRSQPFASYVQSEGEEQVWGEAAVANLEDEWGPIERYIPAPDVLDIATLAGQSAGLIADGYSIPFVLTLQGHPITPGVDFQVGDTLTVNLSDSVLFTTARCQAITVKDSDHVPLFQVELSYSRTGGA